MHTVYQTIGPVLSLSRERGAFFIYKNKISLHCMLELELQKFGLNEKEVKVYLAALELGYASAQDIAKKAGINRATTYFTIESLAKKGLMTQIEKGKKMQFAAEDPRGLRAVIDKKKKEVETTESVFKEILPQLESIYNLAVEKPKVRYYEGLDGAQAMRHEFLQTHGDEIVGFLSLDDLFRNFPKHETEHTPERIKQKIRSRIIYTRKEGPVAGGDKKELMRETRYVPTQQFPFTSDVSMYGDRISMFFLKDKLGGVIIESQELADMMRAIFELAWEGAEKYQK